MAQIVRMELAQALGEIADVSALQPACGDLPDDLFLCALGFEPRCLSIPRQLRAAGICGAQGSLLQVLTNIEDNDVNRPALEDCLSGVADRLQIVEADTGDFTDQLRTLLELTIGESPSNLPTVTLDISVTANRLLLRVHEGPAGVRFESSNCLFRSRRLPSDETGI